MPATAKRRKIKNERKERRKKGKKEGKKERRRKKNKKERKKERQRINKIRTHRRKKEEAGTFSFPPLAAAAAHLQAAGGRGLPAARARAPSPKGHNSQLPPPEFKISRGKSPQCKPAVKKSHLDRLWSCVFGENQVGTTPRGCQGAWGAGGGRRAADHGASWPASWPRAAVRRETIGPAA